MTTFLLGCLVGWLVMGWTTLYMWEDMGSQLERMKAYFEGESERES